jgi:hypothetical protein
MMQKQFIFILSILSSIVEGDHNHTDCERFENKMFQVNVTFPGKKPLYATVHLFPNGVFHEIFSIANGNSEAQVGANFALSNRFGTYTCLPDNHMHFTGMGYLYKTDSVPFLCDNGAVVIHDYHFQFSKNGKTCNGLVKFAVFKTDTNPFSTADQPVFEGDIGVVTCELLEFRPYYDLPGV